MSQNKKLKNACIVRHLDNWRINWELFIIILAIYNAIELPLNIAFQLPMFEEPFWKLLGDFIDYCFMTDILISFRTTYQDPFTGEEVYLPKKIANNYFYGRFWIDLISTIPMEKVVSFFVDDIKIIEVNKLTLTDFFKPIN